MKAHDRQLDTHALINGEKVWFDAQCDNASEPLYKKAFRYIGRSKTVWYDGVEQQLDSYTYLYVKR